MLAVLACTALLAAGCGREEAGKGDGDRVAEPKEVVLTPGAAREGRKNRREQPKAPNSKAQVVELLGAGSAESIEVDQRDDAPSPGAPTDAEVRAELREARASLANFKKHLNTTAFLQTGPRARADRAPAGALGAAHLRRSRRGAAARRPGVPLRLRGLHRVGNAARGRELAARRPARARGARAPLGLG